MDFNAIAEKLKSRFSGIDAPKTEAGDPFAIAPAADAFALLKVLKEDAEFAFDSLMCISGADNGRELWVVYSLHSFQHRHKFTVKVVLGREQPECDSVVPLWGAADFFEREVYDLYGVVFRNHPDLRRLLNPPDWEGWPGRKDYVFPAKYHGVATARQDQYFADTIARVNAEREAAIKAAPASEKK